MERHVQYIGSERERETDRQSGKVIFSHWLHNAQVQREHSSLCNLRRLRAEPRSFRFDYESVRRATVNRLLSLHITLYFSCWLRSFTCGHPSPRLSAQMDVVWLGNKYFFYVFIWRIFLLRNDFSALPCFIFKQLHIKNIWPSSELVSKAVVLSRITGAINSVVPWSRTHQQ